MKQINLLIPKNDLKALEKSCKLLSCEIIEYSDEIATVRYNFATDLFRLGSVYEIYRSV